jgi:pyruvate dehydrogenase E1 component beta subunit
MTSTISLTYGTAIRAGFAWLLENRPECFVIGQGLWSPWYVGNSMARLEEDFGKERVIDTPVSELACTGAAVGAAISGRRPIVVHPRLDFMVLAADQIVTQAASWSSMFGGRSRVPVVVRGIINRGGQQGAQHSQALHSWFAHVPGLRVAMPASVADARDLLISASLSGDPALYIDDRWLYDEVDEVPAEPDLEAIFRGPEVKRAGNDITIVASGYSVRLALDAAAALSKEGTNCEVIDLRVINPLDDAVIRSSVLRTGRLLAVDGGWASCGLAGEIIARCASTIPSNAWRAVPARVTLPAYPAPTSGVLEARYYPTTETVERAIRGVLGR